MRNNNCIKGKKYKNIIFGSNFVLLYDKIMSLAYPNIISIILIK